MTGLEWYGAPLTIFGRAPMFRLGGWTWAIGLLADAQTDARLRGDFEGEWLTSFTPEARARRQADMDRAWWPEEYGDA